MFIMSLSVLLINCDSLKNNRVLCNHNFCVAAVCCVNVSNRQLINIGNGDACSSGSARQWPAHYMLTNKHPFTFQSRNSRVTLLCVWIQSFLCSPNIWGQTCTLTLVHPSDELLWMDGLRENSRRDYWTH